MIDEIWKSVPAFEGIYEASNFGRIRSLDRIVVTKTGVKKRAQGLVLQPNPTVGGYMCVRLGRGNPVLVHQVIAKTFLGPTPEGHQVCHKDGLKQNNGVSNLRYGTPKSNQFDRRAHGTHLAGEQLSHAKLTLKSVEEVRGLFGSKTHEEIANIYGVSRGAITAIALGRNWKPSNKERVQP